MSTQPLLIAAALFAVYIVLGVLYESFIHPLTILLGLPSATVGALLSLKLFSFDLTMMAIIGLIMLIGIVKKKCDHDDRLFALARAWRQVRRGFDLRGCSPSLSPDHDDDDGCAVWYAADRHGYPGADLRQPLGVAVVGGLIVSQALTLLTTPVTYLYMDRFSHFAAAHLRGKKDPPSRKPHAAEARRSSDSEPVVLENVR